MQSPLERCCVGSLMFRASPKRCFYAWKQIKESHKGNKGKKRAILFLSRFPVAVWVIEACLPSVPGMSRVFHLPCLIKCEPKVPFEVQTSKLFTCIVITSEEPRFLFGTAGVFVYQKTHFKSFIIVFLITLMQVHLLLIMPGAAKQNKCCAWLELMRSNASHLACSALERWVFRLKTRKESKVRLCS